MLERIQQLRHRFHDARFAKTIAPRDILAADGAIIGHVDEIRFEQGRLRLQGWVAGARQVTLRIAGLTRSVMLSMARDDVFQKLGHGGEVGFDLSVVLSPDQFIGAGCAVLSFDQGAAVAPLRIDLGGLRKINLRADLSFARAAIRALPACLRWAASRNQHDRARVLDAFDLGAIVAHRLIDPAVFAPVDPARVVPPDQDPARHRITIVLPVYNAFDLLAEVLSRVQAHTDVPFHLILIEDASSDPNVRPFLRAWVTDQRDRRSVTLIENDTNRGFIGSVNSGLALALGGTLPACQRSDIDGPIVLLNSDALVPRGWASRLIAPLLADPALASTTPLSNDAEIFSVPVICRAGEMRPGLADRLDAVARRLNPDAVAAIAPTGVGFCMGLARPWLRKLPQLDRAFGRGYGEEVDWCQSIRAMGGHHGAVGNLFVEHRGGSSFGQADKLAMIAQNNAIVSARYPTYDADVQVFIDTDPLLSARLALAIAWAGLRATAPLRVYLAHSLGGGADHYVKHKLTSDLAQRGPAIVLRVGGARRWRIEVHTPMGVTIGDTDDTDLMVVLLDQVDAFHLVYSCGVGAPDPATLPAVLLRLFDPKTDLLTVLVHDYFMISPSYTLLGSDGAYRGPILSQTKDPAHRMRDETGKIVDSATWQANWFTLLKQAHRVEVFSNSSAQILQTLWPELRNTIQLVPHSLPHLIEKLPVPTGAKACRLGILGGINHAKGAAVLQRLARGSPQLRIVVIGEVDPAFPMPPNVKIHGSYTQDDIAELAIKYRVSRWLIPSIWPETFSFTTHEALATGLPVFAFEIGAQGEAVARAPNGVVIPFDPNDPVGDTHIRALADCLRDHPHPPKERHSHAHPNPKPA